MKSYLACSTTALLATTLSTSVSARYSASSKISRISTNPNPSTLNGNYQTIVSGELIPNKNYQKFARNAQNAKKSSQNSDFSNPKPCYMYFYDDLDINLSFVYLHKAFPLQITNRHIFFWPEKQGTNFTVRFDSNQKYFDTSLLSVYCGDLTDILGRNTIEQENAELVKIGSFPSDPSEIKHLGYVQLAHENLNQESCKVRLHFPQDHRPVSIKMRESSLHAEEVVTGKAHHTFEITGFENIEYSTKNMNVWFDLEYNSIDDIAYSYQVVAEMVECRNIEADEVYDEFWWKFVKNAKKSDEIMKWEDQVQIFILWSLSISKFTVKLSLKQAKTSSLSMYKNQLKLL